MRGQTSLFSKNFVIPEVKVINVAKPRNYYQPERNQALSYRFYFYCEIKRMRYDDTIKQLELEFHLSSHRLINVLNEYSGFLQGVVNSKPTVKELEKKYPWFSWKVSKAA